MTDKREKKSNFHQLFIGTLYAGKKKKEVTYLRYSRKEMKAKDFILRKNTKGTTCYQPVRTHQTLPVVST